MTRVLGGFVLLLLALAGMPRGAPAAALDVAPVAAVLDAAPAPYLSDEAKALFRFSLEEARRFAPLGPPPRDHYPPADLDPAFDVLHYEIALDVDPAHEHFSGRTVVEARALHEGLASIALDYCGPAISAVEVNGVPVVYDWADGRLVVPLAPARARGDSFAITVTYQGTETRGFYWPRYVESPSTFTFSEPEDARFWFPSHDVPWDKATVDLVVTVPPDHVAGANGVLISEEAASGGRRTFHWREQHPIATYLIGVAIAPYAVLHDDRLPGVPIVHFVYRPDSAAARRAFDLVPEMIRFFTERFGPYPFDKYGHACGLFPGGMEHQSLSLLTENAARDSAAWQWLQAHELSHQWFGDAVTPRDWRHIWLNEGFASYADAQWREHVFGMDSLRTRMALFEFFLKRALPFVRIPLVDPPAAQFLTTTIYYKGAWVLHMLRHVVGDDAFFRGLRAYQAAHRYGHADTGDFVAACERAAGRPLDWFFQPWAYGIGLPRFFYGWSAEPIGDDRQRVRVVVRQDADSLFYPMPIDFEFRTPRGVTRRTVFVDHNPQAFTVILDGAPLPGGVLFDPDEWILKEVEEEAPVSVVARDSRLEGLRSIAATGVPPLRFAAVLSAGEAVPLVAEVFDVTGRRVATPFRDLAATGETVLTWDGSTEHGARARSGVYFVRATIGRESRTLRLVLTR